MADLKWINNIFLEPDAPFDMPTIIDITRRLYSSEISESCLWRALKSLSKSSATAAIVAPLDPNEKPRHYTLEGARRICRKAAGSRQPDWKVQAWEDFETKLLADRK